MSHLVKLSLKIIYVRIYKTYDGYIPQNQFGFVNSVGTMEEFFAVQIFVQRDAET